MLQKSDRLWDADYLPDKYCHPESQGFVTSSSQLSESEKGPGRNGKDGGKGKAGLKEYVPGYLTKGERRSASAGRFF